MVMRTLVNDLLDERVFCGGVLYTRWQLYEDALLGWGLPAVGGFGSADWWAFGGKKQVVTAADLTAENFPFGVLVYVRPNTYRRCVIEEGGALAPTGEEIAA